MTQKYFFLSNHIITFVNVPEQLWHTAIFGFSELHFLLAIIGVSIYVLSTVLSTSLTTFHLMKKNKNKKILLECHCQPHLQKKEQTNLINKV